MRNLTEERFDSVELAYVKGYHNLVKDYNQGIFLKKILNGKTYDVLYRFLMEFKWSYAFSDRNPSNWKVGDQIPMELTSTSKINSWASVKKALGSVADECKYVLVFKDVKGYEINYSSKEYKKLSWAWRDGKKTKEPAYSTDVRKQEEVLTAGLFEVESIEEIRGKKVITLKTIDQSKEQFMKILQDAREIRKTERSRNGYYGYAGIEDGRSWKKYKKIVKDIDQTYFHMDNLSGAEIQFLSTVPYLTSDCTMSNLFDFAIIVDRVPVGMELEDFGDILWNLFYEKVNLDSKLEVNKGIIDRPHYEWLHDWMGNKRYEKKDTVVKYCDEFFFDLIDLYNSIYYAKKEFEKKLENPLD